MTNIYTLQDGGKAFYVGQTKDISKRLKMHISDSRKGNSKKDIHIRKMAAAGRLPTIELHNSCEDLQAYDKEKAAIDYYIALGCDLLNVSNNFNKHLTVLERQVLIMLSNDNDTAAIGATLFRSERTIETIRQRLKKKAKVKTLCGLMMWAINNDIIPY